jgi:alpha-tubulin suppressor-like RCC1 family protein
MDSLAPVEVKTIHDVASIVASAYFTCAVTTTGAVWCWGYNEQGQLGNGTNDISSNVPTPVIGFGP